MRKLRLDPWRRENENQQRQESENDDRQGDGESDLHPLHERFAAQARGACVDLRQIDFARLRVAARFEPAALLTELRASIIHRAEGAAQFLRQLRRVPALGLDRFEQLQMLSETLVRCADLFELLLAI